MQLLQCIASQLAAVGGATSAAYCLTSRGQWAVELLSCTASLPWGIGQWNSCNALTHCVGVVSSASPSMHCRTAWRRWAVEHLQCAGPLAGGGRGVLPRRRWLPKQRNSRNALQHCLHARGNATFAMHCLTARAQWASELLSCTTSLPRGRGLWNLCYTLPHYLGAVGGVASAMHLHTASGPWAMEFLQRIATLPGGSGQCNSCHALPHRLGAAGSGTAAMCEASSCGDGVSCPRGGRCLKSGTPTMQCLTAQCLQFFCTGTRPMPAVLLHGHTPNAFSFAKVINFARAHTQCFNSAKANTFRMGTHPMPAILVHGLTPNACSSFAWAHAQCLHLCQTDNFCMGTHPTPSALPKATHSAWAHTQCLQFCLK